MSIYTKGMAPSASNLDEFKSNLVAGGQDLNGEMKDGTDAGDQSSDSTSSGGNDWGKFVVGCLGFLVHVLVMGMIGANFIFFATLPQGTADVPGPTLNDFFPHYVTQYLEFDKPCGPLPTQVNTADLGSEKADQNTEQREGPCYEAAMQSLYPAGDSKSPSGSDAPGLVSSSVLAQGGWNSYFRIKSEYKLAARRVQRELTTLLGSKFRQKDVGGGINADYISPSALLEGLKEEQEHFMKEEQIGKVGLNPTTDNPYPLPPFKNPAIGKILAGVNEIVGASKFQPLYDAKIYKDFKFDPVKMQHIDVQKIEQAEAQGMMGMGMGGMGMGGMGMGGMGMGGTGMGAQSGGAQSGGMPDMAEQAVKAAQQAAVKRQEFEAKQKEIQMAMYHMGQRQTLIVKLQDILSDAVAFGDGGNSGADVAAGVGVLLSKELVEVATEELQAWKACLRGWEDRCTRYCPYFVELGSGQCSVNTRNTFKDVNLITGKASAAIKAAAAAQDKRRIAIRKRNAKYWGRVGAAAQMASGTKLGRKLGADKLARGADIMQGRTAAGTRDIQGQGPTIATRGENLSSAAQAVAKSRGLIQAGGAKQQKFVQSGGQYNRECNPRSNSMLEGLMSAALATKLKSSWPYNMWRYPGDDAYATWPDGPEGPMKVGPLYPERPAPWSGAGFANWFARMIAGNYAFMRGIVVWFVSIFGREDDSARTMLNSDLTLMIIAWLQVALVTVLLPFFAVLSSLNLMWNSFWMFTYRNDPRAHIGRIPWREKTAGGGCCVPPPGPATVPNWDSHTLLGFRCLYVLWKWTSWFLGCWLWPRIVWGPAKYGTAGILVCLLSAFCGISFASGIGGLLGLIQVLQYLITFFIYPVMIAPGIIGDIMKCNAETLALVYGLLVVQVASSTLTPTTAGMMGAVWAFLFLRAVWLHMTS